MADKNTKLVKNAREVSSPIRMSQNQPPLNINVVCENCGKEHRYYINLSGNPFIDMQLQSQDIFPLPVENIVVCDCGTELYLSEIKENISNMG